MNIEEVMKFMKEVGWGTLATTDGQKVGVRPMGGWAWNENELWCATAEASDKITQLKKVPYAEYCFCDAEGKHVRIAGPCTISTDNAEKLWAEAKKAGLDDEQIATLQLQGKLSFLSCNSAAMTSRLMQKQIADPVELVGGSLSSRYLGR